MTQPTVTIGGKKRIEVGPVYGSISIDKPPFIEKTLEWDWTLFIGTEAYCKSQIYFKTKEAARRHAETLATLINANIGVPNYPPNQGV